MTASKGGIVWLFCEEAASSCRLAKYSSLLEIQ